MILMGSPGGAPFGRRRGRLAVPFSCATLVEPAGTDFVEPLSAMVDTLSFFLRIQDTATVGRPLRS